MASYVLPQRPVLIYLVGALKDPKIPLLANQLREIGFDVFDDWHAAGEHADDEWRKYEKTRGRSFAEALIGKHAENSFFLDFKFLCQADIGVLVLPAGKSGHSELGFMAGKGKKTYVLFEGQPERYDLMYRLFTGVVFSVDELIEVIGKPCPEPSAGPPYAFTW